MTVATERVTTVNNCVPRDMIAVGKGRFLFGYNVPFGLTTETKLEDVIAGYKFNPSDQAFSEIPLDFIGDEQFHADFTPVSYPPLRAHHNTANLVCRRLP